ncbi:site-specific integrase [Pontibacter litorisediminis]|uniref:site-specific integrase n=1 Tax=Pontibacter litorisediminis TaxID=1846260 RepID=UPI0023EDC98B|nr:site-specific integrase [Pontibacter litorisediminis]
MKKPNVTFWLKKAAGKEKAKPALIMVNFRYGERIRVSSGISILPSNWDDKKSFPKASFGDYAEYKSKLLEIEEKVHECYRHYTSLGIIPSPETIKQFISGHNDLKHEADIKDFFERHTEFLEERKLRLDPKTIQRDNTLIKQLKQFEVDCKYKVTFESISTSFEVRFRHFLNTVLLQNNTTVGKNIGSLKTYMKWAMKHGYHSNPAFQDFKTDREPTKVIALEEAEVERLATLNLDSKPHLARIRDKFLFQLYTAQRFEDVRTLTWSNIKYTTDGKIYWHLFQTKASRTEEMKVQIVGEAKRVLEQQQKGAPTSLVFPDLKNQPFNRYIKDVCQLAKIDEHTVKVFNRGNKRIEKAGPKYQFISSHTARRSYCTLSSEKGMTELAIRGVTGHKDHRMLMRYLAKNQKHIDAEVNKHWAA